MIGGLVHIDEVFHQTNTVKNSGQLIDNGSIHIHVSLYLCMLSFQFHLFTINLFLMERFW